MPSPFATAGMFALHIFEDHQNVQDPAEITAMTAHKRSGNIFSEPDTESPCAGARNGKGGKCQVDDGGDIKPCG